MFDDEIEDEYDTTCPKCGHSPIRSCRCQAMGCDDGWIDMHEYDDPLWYDEGEEEMCEECSGTGVERWCPKCGFDLQRARLTQREPDDDDSASSQALSTPENLSDLECLS